MSHAVGAAWGNGEQVDACVTSAEQDFEESVRTLPPCAPESLLALHNLAQGAHRITTARRANAYYRSELAQRLFHHYADTPHSDSYLVTGFTLRSNLDGEWEPCFPPHVNVGSSWWGGNVFETCLPSAFQLFVWLADYEGAYAIIQRCPDAFVTPGLRGWRAAVSGFVRPAEAVERFSEATAAFAEDTMPDNEELRQGRSWSSINVELWTMYFRARAAVARLVREPNRVAEQLREAAVAVQGSDSGWANGSVARFRILVQALAQLFGQEPGLTPNQAREQFLRESRWSGEEETDEVSLRFLTLVENAFEGFRTDPETAITNGQLSAALETLGRIPILGPNVRVAITPAIGALALREAHGPDRTWVYRTLEAIRDERLLRGIILRLIQASPSPPAYGQLRHGPLEYGKDVVVLLEEDGRNVLRMYQAKCGDITIPGWREVRPQLEEIFLADIAPLQLRGPVDAREGILICNGHARPQVEPTMQGWFTQELRDHNHTFRFMHLDDIVNWIFNQRLFSAFRSACAELQLPLV